MSSDGRITFRFLVDKMLHYKSSKYSERVWERINKVLTYSNQDTLSSETVVYIMVEINKEFGELK